MKIHVQHLTNYQYTEKVSLGLHNLFLLPQYKPYYQIEHQKINLNPKSVDQNYRQDLAGNWFFQSWFSVETDQFEIETNWIFKLDPFNPFSFIIESNFEQSAWNTERPIFNYKEAESFLQPFLSRTELVDYWDLLLPIKEKSTGLIDFLVRLTQQLYEDWPHLIRHEQNIWEPSYTFSERKGSCRDLAFMQMDMLRSMGLACRFVSGYAYNPMLDDGHELHAWLEVFLPGAGWVGLDPSLGLFADHYYIPLAAHPEPYATMPVKGTYFGSASSKLTTQVGIKLI
ncbi:MAG: transglutaminase family protein [Algoriphagus sp.]|uniref:transglutaminase family protein n=1 Tax=Algoriphagus sp. TaxID=1872435 RepID=UPI0017F4CA4C|nr:transglutaminase family protein [Algoriphagus sp.]NVJ85235.1 transglutaminase family protein [Algoriphagus sp.]